VLIPEPDSGGISVMKPSDRHPTDNNRMNPQRIDTEKLLFFTASLQF
jgi:hypothetical protein